MDVHCFKAIALRQKRHHFHCLEQAFFVHFFAGSLRPAACDALSFQGGKIELCNPCCLPFRVSDPADEFNGDEYLMKMRNKKVKMALEIKMDLEMRNGLKN